jgi:HEAT repeat protein
MHIHLITPFRRSRVGLLSLLAVLAASVAWGAWHAQRVPRLIARLNHPDLRVRAAAARQLGELRDERAVPPLIHRMRHDCVEVSAAAMEALGAIGGPEATAALIEEARGPKGLSTNARQALQRRDSSSLASESLL